MMFIKFPAIRTVAPADIMSLVEAKAHVRRDDDDDDAYITSLIKVVQARFDGVDGILGLMLIDQTWKEIANSFPVGDCFWLDLMPVTAIESIQYFDEDNSTQIFASSNYSFHTGLSGSYIKLNFDASWPSTYDRDDAVTVTYSGGYGATSAAVPPEIIHAAKLMLGNFYENRESVVIGSTALVLPMAVNSLLRPFVRSKF